MTAVDRGGGARVIAIDRRAWITGTLALGVAACGRRRDLPTDGPAHRIASQTILSDEILWDLGEPARARVVAVSALVDDPRYSTIADVWPPGIPRTPLTSEALLAMSLDLAIVADFTAAETRELLQAAGVRLLLLQGFDGFADYRRHVVAIADVAQARDRGDALVHAFDDRLASVRAPAVWSRPTILGFAEGNVAGAGTTFDEIVTAAGFVNVAAQHGVRGHGQLALDQLVAWDPHALVVPCGADDGERVAAEIAAREGIAATRAAREGRVIAIPSALLYSAGAKMLDVVERLRAHHPDAA